MPRVAILVAVLMLIASLPGTATAELLESSGQSSLFSLDTRLATATDDIEDRVDIQWSPWPQNDITYRISRILGEDSRVLGRVSSQDTAFEDLSGVPGQIYTYKVEVLYDDGSEEVINTDEGSRVINAPTMVKATDGIFDDRVEVRWKDNSRVEAAYVVKRDGSEIARLSANTTFYQDTEANGSATSPHNYTVEAVDAVGNASVAGADTGWRGVILPPTSVAASDGLYTDRVLIVWSGSMSASENYRIVRKSGGPDVDLAAATMGDHSDGLPLRTFADTSPVDGTTYSYCVSTLTGGAGISASVEVCDEGGIGILSVPRQVRASDNTFDDRVQVTWVDLSGLEDGFRILRDGTETGSTGADVTTYNDFSAVPGTDYNYQVIAFSNIGGVSAQSNVDAGRRSFVLAPENLQATRGTFEDKVELNWENFSTTAQYFNLYRSSALIPPSGSLKVDHINDSDDGMRVANPNMPTTALTFEMWIRTTQGSISGVNHIMPIYSGQGGNSNQLIIANIDNLEVLINNQSRVSGVSFNSGQWHHLAITWSSNGAVLKLFKDGVEVRSYSNFAGGKSIIAAPLYIGARWFKGELDDVRLWDRVRTPAEIRQTMRRPLNGTEAGLVGYWPLYEQEGTTVTDHSISGRHGVLNPSYASWSLDAAPIVPGFLVKTLSKDTRFYVDRGGAAGADGDERLYLIEAAMLPHPANNTAPVFSAAASVRGYKELAAPTGVTATDDAFEDRVVITWNDNSQVETGYNIYRQGTDGAGVGVGNAVKIGNNTSGPTVEFNRTSYADLTGMPGTTYTYEVRTVNADGESAAGVSVDTGSRLLRAASGVEASDGIFEEKVEVRWRDNSDIETGYVIYRQAVGDGGQGEGNADRLGETTAGVTLFEDDNPQGNALYGVFPKASQSVFSNPISAADFAALTSVANSDTGKTALLAPSEFNASSNYTDKVVLNWVDLSNMNTGYKIYRDGVLLSDQVSGNATSYIDNQSGDGSHLYSIVAYKDTVVSEADSANGIKLVVNESTAADFITLTPSDGQPGDEFGKSMAADGNWVVIGAPGANSGNGKVYVFENQFNDLEKTWTWTEIVKLENPNSNGTTSFGASVAINGKTVLAASLSSNDDGSIYSVQLNESGHAIEEKYDGVVSLVAPAIALFRNDIIYGVSQGGAKLSGVDLTPYKSNGVRFGPELTGYGKSVALSDKFALVGASGSKVFIFDRSKLNSTDRTAFIGGETSYGESVALGGNSAFIGAPGSNSAFVLTGIDDFLAGGNYWKQWELPKPGSAINGTKFGFSGAIDSTGKYILISGVSSNQKGTMYFYFDNGIRWESQKKFETNIPSGSDAGRTVVLANNWGLIGEPTAFDSGRVFAKELFPFVQPPDRLRVSDGKFNNRVQITWQDVADNEDTYWIFRDGEQIGSEGANATSFSDFDAIPGQVYTYCVSAAAIEGGSPRVCDQGWRPLDGGISGRIISQAGAGLEDVAVCLDPAPNSGLLLDGIQGSVLIEQPVMPDTAFTIEMWLRTSDTGPNRFLFSYASAENSNAMTFYNMGNLSVGMESSVWTTTGVALNDGQWHHLAITWQNSTGEMHIYKDGALAFYSGDGPGTNYYIDENGNLTEKNDRIFAQDHTIIPGGVLVLGQDQDNLGGGFQESQAYRGQMDEVRIWNQARTQQEIQATMNQPLTGREDGLIGYWPLDENKGDLVADHSRANPSGSPDSDLSNRYGRLQGGAYWSRGSDLVDFCTITGREGNYVLSNISYGEETAFKVVPSKAGRIFRPGFKEVILNTGSPLENQVDLTDITAYSVSGRVLYKDTNCPVPGAQINVSGNENLFSSTDNDGRYAMVLDLGQHTLSVALEQRVFDPETISVDIVAEDISGQNFFDTTTRTFLGFAGGGCARLIGDVQIEIRSEDNCLVREETVTGDFRFDLPPLRYAVRVLDVQNVPSALDKAAVLKFFERAGAFQVDLTQEDQRQDLLYRAPLRVEIVGLTELIDEDREFCLAAPILEQNAKVPLIIKVEEDYGASGSCGLDEGTVMIFDELSDQGDQGQPVSVKNGIATYKTVAKTPNVFAGRTDSTGNNRDYQKAIKAIVEVPGLAPASDTKWAVVTGARLREGTEFLTATTGPVALLVLRDPPGDQSYSYLEKGYTLTRTINWDEFTLSGGSGVAVEISTGPNISIGGGFGIFILNQLKARIKILDIKTLLGASTTEENRTIVSITALEEFATSGDDTFVGEDGDIFIGGAFNILFGISDKIQVVGGRETCTVVRTDVVSIDRGFDTNFAYTHAHIANVLIPKLKSLKIAAANNTINEPTKIEGFSVGSEDFYKNQIDSWNKILNDNRASKQKAKLSLNRSFSAGADFTYTYGSETTDAHTFTRRFWTNTEGATGGLEFGSAVKQLEISAQFTLETDSLEDRDLLSGVTDPARDAPIGSLTNDNPDNLGDLSHDGGLPGFADIERAISQQIGYVLSDNDPGDEFTVDIKNDKKYPAPVFEVLAGRSSNPWEPWYEYKDSTNANGDTVFFSDTAKPRMVPRHKAVISIDPDSRPQGKIPVGKKAAFTLQLINDSQSGEDAEYHLRALGTSNPYGAQLSVNGSGLGGPISFLIGAQQQKEVTLEVARGPRKYNYTGLELMLYPPGEYALWEDGGPGLPPRLSDVVTFDIEFESPCSEVELFRPESGWTFSRADIGNSLELILDGFDLSDDRLDRIEVQYRRQGHDGVEGPGTWHPLQTLEADQLTAGQSYTIDWDLDNALSDDGVYELRAFTVCESGRIHSATVPGTVDRKAPQVIGTPQPADGRLSLGEDIALTFDELIRCEGLQTANVSLVKSDNVALDVDWTCDGRSLFLTPSAGWEGLEGEQLTASIEYIHIADDTEEGVESGIVDLSNNPHVADITWTFWVRRQAFAWDQSTVQQNIDLGTPLEFSALLVNGSEQVAAFELEVDKADWLAPVEPAIILAPGVTTTVRLAVPADKIAGLKDALVAGDIEPNAQNVIASQQVYVTARGANLGTAVLQVDIDIVCIPPDWQIDPNDFAHSMSLVAEVFIGGEVSRTEDGDIIAAFVDDELRGVGQVELVSTQGHRLNLNINSNVLEGEDVRFEIWDASTCFRYPTSDLILPFAADAFIGSPATPIALNARRDDAPGNIFHRVAIQHIPLGIGWNWFSLNVVPADARLFRVLSSLFMRPGDQIFSTAVSNTLDEQFRWAEAGLQSFDPLASYQIRLQDRGTLTVYGEPIDPQTPIPLAVGWNWIPYLPQVSLEINKALKEYPAAPGDLIKGQSSFAQYVQLNPHEGRWLGSLRKLEPGQGYRLLSGKERTLRYPAAAPGPIPLATKPVSAPSLPEVDGQPWQLASEAHPHSMAVSATFVHNGRPLNDVQQWIGAFVGDQLRGVGQPHYVESLDQHRVFMVVHGGGVPQEKVEFKVFDPHTQLLQTAGPGLAFEAKAIHGSVEVPVVFEVGGDGSALPQGFYLFQNVPNPFNPSTEIAYQLPQGGEVSLVVYNVLGQPVRVLQRGGQEAGYYRVTWDGTDGYGQPVASGLYFYRLDAVGKRQTRRLMLLK